ncbi:hypothetical protein [Rhizobium rhizogenes]|uniref:Uncharacterized protein n=1 Tax=Rhizobium rhizogenes NBRC 13257 TaxID=1220581 RepID=A0AA87Q237_RHIRH|nr:hypothetical protein [Rhizobium rhizogenes]NTG67268.1 hypothetical protein [Rhizobium rhizogenes]TRB14317.1 hypothetical protein EXN67_01470 [Rhizobium rhizogenes]TRB47107.1 hypothetical protein EXN73_01470 [Rhizobium rhizogenes]TRB64874.1 hypothetical protein EXN71_01470 [Rhizobium rhizogenes]GAJ91039.1 hypothetical protein RRH01S_01_05100 [Rhizobium rhizogenes NBRC 13257]
MAKEEKKGVVATKAVTKPFPLSVNEARGEAPLWIADVPLVLAAEMSRLAAVSSRLQCKSLNDLFLRLSGVEAAATWAGIELLTVKGDVVKALEALKLQHFTACAVAFSAILAHHFDGDEGNAGAVDEAA